MNAKFFCLLCGIILKITTTNCFVNVDTKLDPEMVNGNQVFFNRKERFIKFDTKDNELEIELGISIPFIKVPLTTRRDLSSERQESNITINAPGLIVAGMLMFTSIIIVPLLFTTTSPESAFGFQRKGKRDIWSAMEDINAALSKNGIDSSSCMQKSICWVTKASKGGKDGSIGQWINNFIKSSWMNRLIRGTFVEEAMDAASGDVSCEAKYSHCSFKNNRLQSFMKTITTKQT